MAGLRFSALPLDADGAASLSPVCQRYRVNAQCGANEIVREGPYAATRWPSSYFLQDLSGPGVEDKPGTKAVGCATVLTSDRKIASGSQRAQVVERSAEQVLAQVEEPSPE
jgi:hypothetical protein